MIATLPASCLENLHWYQEEGTKQSPAVSLSWEDRIEKSERPSELEIAERSAEDNFTEGGWSERDEETVSQSSGEY